MICLLQLLYTLYPACSLNIEFYYFYDSAHTVNIQPPLSHLTNGPLWDGAGCVSGSCCTFNSPPWFCKNLSTPTTDAIELRNCLNDGIHDEDVLIEIVELYVQSR